ncbi:hypothetical protein PFICI_10710 [Pestalotiopsis fici W106-1]|uniref:Uncharacterized protein n=1 Tax=Pestalotiopsis fici (strain W106-1 / CGMCC3.15140) TaxID=1229662 RepID=W3WVH1_PESFW|nr:uncharacterized protein PFICI_10710 [Pestalotiopsis fici W106-1]ETS76836.1 hypothetical protein PFICI_10710 [Pestalotiopsis fici W106-1]
MGGTTLVGPDSLESAFHDHIMDQLPNPDLLHDVQEVTAGDLAKALRKLAIDEQMQTMSIINTPSLALVAQDALSKGFSGQGDIEKDLVVSSPRKKVRIGTYETAHIPLGDFRPTTEQHISIASSSHNKEIAPSDTKGSYTRELTPEPTHEGVGLPTTPRSCVLATSSPQGSPMRRHGGIPSGSSPSPLRPQMGDNVPGFSAGVGTSQRKAAPSRLNLSLPGAAPRKTTNDATHYVAVASYMGTHKPNIPELQAQIDKFENARKTPLDKRTKLLKVPIYNLESDELDDESVPFKIQRIPQTPASALVKSFKKFTLATPATAALSNAARARHMAIAQRAEFEATNQVDQNEVGAIAGQLNPTQPEYRPRRTEQILEALHNGRGNTRRLRQLALGIHSRISLSAKSPPPATGCYKPPFDVITALSRVPELIMAVAEYLPPRDVLTLYSVSLQFHVQMNTYLQSTVVMLSRQWAPNAIHVFKWDSDPTYKHLAIRDPVGRVLASPTSEDEDNASTRPLLGKVKRVPSMKYYQMVAFRDDVVIDILAHLARYGLRCPQGAKDSVLKLWMLMDQPTTKQRQELLMKTEVFTDQDLVNLTIFMTKVNFRLSDPIYGPESADLSELMFGQRSLYPLWQMLFGQNYRDLPSLLRCKIRYDLGRDWRLGQAYLGADADPDYLRPDGLGLLGVPPNEIGRTQLEHWGTKGSMHPALQRPSACIMAEAARRDLRLDQHLMGLLLWGHVDHETGRNLVPSEAEIWMRDSDYKNRALDTHLEFEPFHLRRARWDELDEHDRKKILLAQQVRHEAVYKWDEHRFDDPDLTEEENMEMNRDMQEKLLKNAGVDRENPDFKVDKNGNEIPRQSTDPDKLAAGPITSSFNKVQEEYEHDFGYESDSSTDSPTAQSAIGDTTKLQYAWKPSPEDHDMHVPYVAATSLGSTSRSRDDDLDQNSNLDNQTVDGDVSFEGDDEPDREMVWQQFLDLRDTAFAPWASTDDKGSS